MSMFTKQPLYMIHLVALYQAPLERYARRLLVAKHCAPKVVVWVMEEAEQEKLFFNGPHLRPLLIAKTKATCSGLNKAVEIANYYKVTSAPNAGE